MTVFVCEKDFECEKTGSIYVKGYKYTVRPGNEILAKRLVKWIKEGKASIVSRQTQRPKGQAKER